jgi:hypothetical protein
LWTSDDEANWNSFLSSNTGKRLLPKLAENAPLLLDGTEVNKTLVRNGELRGFQAAVQALLVLSHAQPLAQTGAEQSNYPALEDDSKWADGQKLTPEIKG